MHQTKIKIWLVTCNICDCRDVVRRRNIFSGCFWEKVWKKWWIKHISQRARNVCTFSAI